MKARIALAAAAALLLSFAGIATPSGAATIVPKITKAFMKDADRDDHADRVQLTYNVPVTHASDADGTYPFSVASYTITKVGAASGSLKLMVFLQEKASPDIAAAPSVTYTQTSSKPVTDGAGTQAANQTFTKTKPLDLDGDGYTAVGGDCAPKNASIHPGALDDPDLSFVDTNCDGIDGDASGAVFVSTVGNDANAGTRAAPLLHVNAAIAMASASVPTKDVYVSSGAFDEGNGLALADDVGVYGGYSAADWSRSLAGTTVIWGTRQAARADGDTGVVLQLLDLHSSALAVSSYSVYGLIAVNSSSVLLQRVDVSAGAGSAGANGFSPPGQASAGGDGTPGGPGVENGGLFCLKGSRPQGGAGGSSPVSAAQGGQGGSAGQGGSDGSAGSPSPGGASGGPGTPYGMGDWSTPSTYWGADGANSAPGANGLGGTMGSFGADGYIPNWGGSGAPAQYGFGGGGGGGGGGGTVDCDSYGGGGGGGGAGGAGGASGAGGGPGGGSIGIYAWSSTVVIQDSSTVATGSGGGGGTGGTGQPGGTGGIGALPSGPGNYYGVGQDDGSNGGRGGDGGDAGRGGHGGGGAGGPSIGVLYNGASTLTIDPSTTITPGAGGARGLGPGYWGSVGISVAVHTA